MKTSLLLLCLPVLFTACASDDEPSSSRRTTAHHGSEHDRDRREHEASRREHSDEPMGREPRVGMSKRQIEDMYGEPSSRNHTAHGEVWTYWFNRGHAFIPYNFGYKPRTGTLTFNSSGRVVDYSWNE